MAVGVVGVWRGVGTMRRTYLDARCHWSGGCRWGLVAVPVGPGCGAGGAWLRCRWGLVAVPVGGGGAWPWCPLAAATIVSTNVARNLRRSFFERV